MRGVGKVLKCQTAEPTGKACSIRLACKAAPKDKVETMAAATSERESLEVRMRKLLRLKMKTVKV